MTCMCLSIATAAERAEVGRILIGNGYRVWQQTIRVGGKPKKVLMADIPEGTDARSIPKDGNEGNA